MGFLDNSSVTVDAILTKRGREILAAGGDLNITKFALSDEEIDYTLYDVTHPNGTDSYGAVIENMSLLEATPNRTTFRSFLVNQSQAGATLNVDNTNIVRFEGGGPTKTKVGTSAILKAQSINTAATTDVTIQGQNSGLVQTVTISVTADPASSVDPLSSQDAPPPPGVPDDVYSSGAGGGSY